MLAVLVHSAALITLVTYAATDVQFAVALRSWKGAYPRSQVPELQTPAVDEPPLMIAWPFLFCQKPIVRAPVLAGPQTSTVWLPLWPVSTITAVLVNLTQLN